MAKATRKVKKNQYKPYSLEFDGEEQEWLFRSPEHTKAKEIRREVLHIVYNIKGKQALSSNDSLDVTSADDLIKKYEAVSELRVVQGRMLEICGHPDNIGFVDEDGNEIEPSREEWTDLACEFERDDPLFDFLSTLCGLEGVLKPKDPPKQQPEEIADIEEEEQQLPFTLPDSAS